MINTAQEHESVKKKTVGQKMKASVLPFSGPTSSETFKYNFSDQDLQKLTFRKISTSGNSTRLKMPACDIFISWHFDKLYKHSP